MQNQEELSKSRTCRIVTEKVRRNQQKYHPTERHRAVGKHLAFRDNPCEQDSATQDALRNELPPLPHCKHSIGDGSSAGDSQRGTGHMCRSFIVSPELAAVLSPANSVSVGQHSEKRGILGLWG